MVRQHVSEKMDAPNAPNPANPSAQDQFVDAVQGHTNQAQGMQFKIRSKDRQFKTNLQFKVM